MGVIYPSGEKDILPVDEIDLEKKIYKLGQSRNLRKKLCESKNFLKIIGKRVIDLQIIKGGWKDGNRIKS